MRDPALDILAKPRERQTAALDRLMPERVRDILVVSSPYDSFTFEEDGNLTEALLSEYLELNLRFAPRLETVSTPEQALARLGEAHFDLVVAMLRAGGSIISDFAEAVAAIAPGVPVLLLAYNTREIGMLEDARRLPGIHGLFVWLGDVGIFLAMIKHVEDHWNVEHDVGECDVQCIILIEDSTRFCSSYLPMLCRELMVQTQAVMADGVTRMQKLMRMRARPKILLATDYEQAVEIFERYRDNVMGVITDASFPRGGVQDPRAGIRFTRMVKEDRYDRPVLIQSSDDGNAAAAKELEAAFVNKRSPNLLRHLRQFMLADLGFGDFLFKLEDGSVVGTAKDLRSLVSAIKTVPDESIRLHAARNHFSSWLMARTEVELARSLRPVKADEFPNTTALRRFLLSAVTSHRDRSQEGVVAEFSDRTFDADSRFVRIGEGSLGGKGRGLAFVNSVMGSYEIEGRVPGVRIFVPHTAVLATGIFERFVGDSGLAQQAMDEPDDDRIAAAFLEERLPEEAIASLKTFLGQVRYPLAVRSSSLLEDAYYQPFAGVYQTYMLPNNDPDPRVRLRELCNAIKLVYASTYYSGSKGYIQATTNRLEEERMAVVIQQVVGRTHGRFLYPDLAGVARAHDFYAMEGIKREDGVASVALGLGRTVVEGGRCVRFSPAQPRRLYQFSSTRDFLDNAQREFFALDLSMAGPRMDTWAGAESNLATLGLDVAQKHGTLRAVGSVYSPENDAVYDGTSRKGVRLVTMAGVLKGQAFPLAETLSFLLELGTAGLSCPVEIEFAANLSSDPDRPHDFGFLQIRPMVLTSGGSTADIEGTPPERAVCMSSKALGHGRIDGVRDIVYVRPDTFERARTAEIAAELGRLNLELRGAQRPYLLIGPGRWGSADHWLGIPVTWPQINGASCIVETDMHDMRVTPSQGTHFFQNITSLGIGYLTINQNDPVARVDYEWLMGLEAVYESTNLRRVSFEEPLDIVVDSVEGGGLVLKPTGGTA